MKEPLIRVGILSAPQIAFELSGHYQLTASYCQGVVNICRIVSGTQSVRYREGGIEFEGRAYETFRLDPLEEECSLELKDVVIGIGFHWERKENQRFQGALQFLAKPSTKSDEGWLIAINLIRVEAYLTSVISSEMSATASPELLKAHAVISRSWLLNNLDRPSAFSPVPSPEQEGKKDDDDELLTWYERDAHTRFDVCADDHCQRYQGITRASTEAVRQAVAATRGEVLAYGGRICDARFSKCCGGMLEEFASCWADRSYPYLLRKRDWISRDAQPSAEPPFTPDLTQEAEAERWIRTAPEAFCHTTDPQVLAQVLNHYDRETPDFYRWRVTYTQEELATLIRERTETDYGAILDLVPVARGTSGRIWKLKIVGTRHTRTIGKELEIRRTLSTSHLYSSAFVVDREEVSPEGIPGRFVLTGAGWGHGVGLCQIGAAVMGAQGYGYKEILQHYYPNAQIKSFYE